MTKRGLILGVMAGGFLGPARASSARGRTAARSSTRWAGDRVVRIDDGDARTASSTTSRAGWSRSSTAAASAASRRGARRSISIGGTALAGHAHGRVGR